MRLDGDLPRDWTKATYRFYSWWVRKTWRDNKGEFAKVFQDEVIYGSGYWKITPDGKAQHVPMDELKILGTDDSATDAP